MWCRSIGRIDMCRCSGEEMISKTEKKTRNSDDEIVVIKVIVVVMLVMILGKIGMIIYMIQVMAIIYRNGLSS